MSDEHKKTVIGHTSESGAHMRPEANGANGRNDASGAHLRPPNEATIVIPTSQEIPKTKTLVGINPIKPSTTSTSDATVVLGKAGVPSTLANGTGSQVPSPISSPQAVTVQRQEHSGLNRTDGSRARARGTRSTARPPRCTRRRPRRIPASASISTR